MAALQSPARRKLLKVIIALVSAFGLLQCVFYSDTSPGIISPPFVYAEAEAEAVSCSPAYYTGICPAYSDTAAGGLFERRPVSIDRSHFYHVVPAAQGASLTDPYTVTKGDSSTFEVLADVQITGLGSAQAAAIGSDLQGKYLYLIINDKTAVIDKDTLEWGIYDFAFGQTNIVQGKYIYSLKPDGIWTVDTESKTAFWRYGLEIIVDKESTARMYLGCARFLVRRDGELMTAVFDPEAEEAGTGTPLSYIRLEDQDDCDCTAEGTINYLIGITPEGKTVAASRTDAHRAYVRAWDAEGEKLASLCFDIYSGFSASSGVFPVYTHDRDICYVYTTSYAAVKINRKTYHQVSMYLYRLENGSLPLSHTDTNSYESNLFDRPLYAVYTNYGSVIAARGCIWKSANASVRSAGFVIHCEEGAASSLASPDTLRSHLEYSYISDHGIWLMTSNKTDGEFILSGLSFGFEFTDNSKKPVETQDPGIENEGGRQNEGAGTQDPEQNEGYTSPSAIQWRLHRVY